MQNRTDSNRIDLALLVLRVVVGVVFLAHGSQKLFVFGFGGVTHAFAGMGVPAPALTGPLTALVEFFGGLALITGLLTRIAGLGITLTMLGAISFVHLSQGFFAPKGIELPLTLLGGAITLAIAGAGRFSLDHLIAARRGVSAIEPARARRVA